VSDYSALFKNTTPDYTQGTTDLNEAVHQLEMLRLRGELTEDAVAEMMGQYLSTASRASSVARPMASNRHQNVSCISGIATVIYSSWTTNRVQSLVIALLLSIGLHLVGLYLVTVQ